jgi:hypothetical protein
MPIPNDTGVQMIEHGVVWIAYRPELPAADVQQLRDLIRDRKYILLSPGPTEAQLSNNVVATSRVSQYKADRVNSQALAEFLDQFAIGPQPPAPGAPCADEAESASS